MVKLLDKLEHERVNRIGPFVVLKENGIRNVNDPPQTPPPPQIVNVIIVQNQTPIISNAINSTEERIKKLEKKLLNDDADDFLFCLKHPLTN